MPQAEAARPKWRSRASAWRYMNCRRSMGHTARRCGRLTRPGARGHSAAMSPIPEKPAVAGLLLAGGRALRMGGGDKCLRLLGGRPLLEHVTQRLQPQLRRLVLNAN